MDYHTNVGPRSGPLLSRAGYYAIGIRQGREIRTPIGVALVAGQDQNGLALWRLAIDDVEVPGLWIVVDREFRPAGSTVGNVHSMEPADSRDRQSRGDTLEPAP